MRWIAGIFIFGSVVMAGEPVATRPAATQPAGVSLLADSPSPATQTATYEPRQAGGEPESIVQIARLIYAGTKSSRCFSDHFLARAQADSAISTTRRFHTVKLGSADMFEFPLAIMTGEGEFVLSEQERKNLREYCERGGMILASAGCSSAAWDRAFRHEMSAVFPEATLETIGMDHPIFHMVYDIPVLQAAQGEPRPLEIMSIGGRVAIVYSPDGLNDSAHAHNCCCCGGNEIINAIEINVNVLAYALVY